MGMQIWSFACNVQWSYKVQYNQSKTALHWNWRQPTQYLFSQLYIPLSRVGRKISRSGFALVAGVNANKDGGPSAAVKRRMPSLSSTKGKSKKLQWKVEKATIASRKCCIGPLFSCYYCNMMAEGGYFRAAPAVDVLGQSLAHYITDSISTRLHEHTERHIY